jgi:hypothetical protein
MYTYQHRERVAERSSSSGRHTALLASVVADSIAGAPEDRRPTRAAGDVDRSGRQTASAEARSVRPFPRGLLKRSFQKGAPCSMTPPAPADSAGGSNAASGGGGDGALATHANAAETTGMETDGDAGAQLVPAGAAGDLENSAHAHAPPSAFAPNAHVAAAHSGGAGVTGVGGGAGAIASGGGPNANANANANAAAAGSTIAAPALPAHSIGNSVFTVKRLRDRATGSTSTVHGERHLGAGSSREDSAGDSNTADHDRGERAVDSTRGGGRGGGGGGGGGETASHTTPFAWCTPFLKDFSHRHSSPAFPFQRYTGKTFD